MKGKSNLVFNTNFLGFDLKCLFDHSLNILVGLLFCGLENLFVLF